jgi:hypothetical protein
LTPAGSLNNTGVVSSVGDLRLALQSLRPWQRSNRISKQASWSFVRLIVGLPSPLVDWQAESMAEEVVKEAQPAAFSASSAAELETIHAEVMLQDPSRTVEVLVIVMSHQRHRH